MTRSTRVGLSFLCLLLVSAFVVNASSMAATNGFRDRSTRPKVIALLPAHAEFIKGKILMTDELVDESLALETHAQLELAKKLEEKGYEVRRVTLSEIQNQPGLSDIVLAFQKRYRESWGKMYNRRDTLEAGGFFLGDSAVMLGDALEVDAIAVPNVFAYGIPKRNMAFFTLLTGGIPITFQSGFAYMDMGIVSGSTGRVEAFFRAIPRCTLRALKRRPDDIMRRAAKRTTNRLPEYDEALKTRKKSDEDGEDYEDGEASFDAAESIIEEFLGHLEFEEEADEESAVEDSDLVQGSADLVQGSGEEESYKPYIFDTVIEHYYLDLQRASPSHTTFIIYDGIDILSVDNGKNEISMTVGFNALASVTQGVCSALNEIHQVKYVLKAKSEMNKQTVRAWHVINADDKTLYIPKHKVISTAFNENPKSNTLKLECSKQDIVDLVFSPIINNDPAKVIEAFCEMDLDGKRFAGSRNTFGYFAEESSNLLGSGKRYIASEYSIIKSTVVEDKAIVEVEFNVIGEMHNNELANCNKNKVDFTYNLHKSRWGWWLISEYPAIFISPDGEISNTEELIEGLEYEFGAAEGGEYDYLYNSVNRIQQCAEEQP